MAADHHWVKDLFPPVFQIDCHDVTPLGEDANQLPAASVYELAAKRISRYDPDTIKNVYERVWLLDTARQQEQARRHQEQEDETRKEAEEAAEKCKERYTADPTGALVQDTIGVSDPALPPAAPTDQLWSADELSELRNVSSVNQKENTTLKVSLTESQQRVKELEKYCMKQSEALSEKVGFLTEAKKANVRLQILVENLKQEVAAGEKENEEIHDDLEDLREKKSDVDKELSVLRKESDAERIRRVNLEFDLEDCQHAADRTLGLHKEKLTAQFSLQVAGLQAEMDKLRVELEQERKDHARSRKGLEHLQKHFSMLPLQSVEKRGTMVTENQLSSWSY